jgi:hypothetical protein
MSLQHKLQQQLEQELNVHHQSTTDNEALPSSSSSLSPSSASSTDAQAGTLKNTQSYDIIQVKTVIDLASYYPKERQAVLKLYKQLRGNNYTDTMVSNELWNEVDSNGAGTITLQNAYHCHWIGITCGTILAMKEEIVNSNVDDVENVTILSPFPMLVVQEINWTHFHFNGTISGRFLSKLTFLKSVDLSYNRLLHHSVPFLELSKLQYLQSLHLQHNSLTGSLPSFNYDVQNDYVRSDAASSKAIPQKDIIFPNLIEFNLANNAFTGTVTVPNCWYMPQVQIYDASDNLLSGEMYKVPYSTYESDRSAHDNDTSVTIEANGGSSANAEFARTMGLRFLILSNNAITGVIPDFPSEEFPNLISLDLSCNLFSGYKSSYQSSEPTTAIKALPEIPNSLWDLLLFNNLLSGPFVSPKLWGSSYSNKNSSSLHLQMLSLSNNQFTGRIPIDGWHKLRNLGVLMMNHNQFTGTIPVSLLTGQATSLGLLDISYNKLTGSIATEIALMNALHTIDAMSNQLTGQIPNEMIHMNPNLRLNFTDNLQVS